MVADGQISLGNTVFKNSAKKLRKLNDMVVVGFALSIPANALVYSQLFPSDLGFTSTVMPTWYATVQALSIGVLIPALSSIIPAKRALSKTLSESLAPSKSSASGLVVTIEDTESQ